MKNQKQKEYETPQTTLVEVELEQGFMNASTFDEKKTNNLEINNHDVDETFDFSSNEEWK